MTNAPWFLAALRDGSAQIRYAPEPVAIARKSVGTVEFPSGRARAAIAHQFAQGAPDLDVPVSSGAWQVDQLVTGALTDDGSEVLLVSLLAREGIDLAELAWAPATAAGRPVPSALEGLVIGDADDSRTLGEGEGARCWPWLVGFLSAVEDQGAANAENERIRAHRSKNPDSPIRLLTPDSTLAVYDGPSQHPLNPPADIRMGFTVLWVGTDASGLAHALVVDPLTAAEDAVRLPSITDPWSGPRATAGTVVDNANLTDETADLNALIGASDGASWIEQGTVDLDGTVAVARARMSSPRRLSEYSLQPYPLPFRGRGPARVLTRAGANIGQEMLVILDNSCPTRWAWFEPAPTATERGGDLVIATLGKLERANTDPEEAFAFSQQCNWPMAAALRQDSSLVAGYWADQGEEPGAELVGLDAEGGVVALYFASHADNTVYTVRPPEQDEALITRLRESSFTDEYAEESRQRLLARIEAGEAVTPQARGLLHWLVETGS